MATKRTTWFPDTCGCKFVYEWNTEVPEAERTHTVKTVKACPAHQGHPNGQAVFAAVLAENRRKNGAKVE